MTVTLCRWVACVTMFDTSFFYTKLFWNCSSLFLLGTPLDPLQWSLWVTGPQLGSTDLKHMVWMDEWMLVVQRLGAPEVDKERGKRGGRKWKREVDPGKRELCVSLTILVSCLRAGLKLMYFVRTIYSLHKWCHKLYPADLAGGLPKLLIQPNDLWPLYAGTSFWNIMGLWRFREETSGLAAGGEVSPDPTVGLSGSRGHPDRGRAPNEFMFSFPPFFSLLPLFFISAP